MFNRIKNRVLTVVAPDQPALPAGPGHQAYGGGGTAGSRTGSANRDYDAAGGGGGGKRLPKKFQYARPPFLQLLTYDELKASADHNVRPIIVPRDISLLPWSTGYAECVNSGKSKWNEDQAAFHRQVLSHPSRQYHDLPYTYFGIYDGHAGYGAALAAANQFHYILHEKLVDVIDLLMPRVEGDGGGLALHATLPHPSLFHKQVSKDELIVGALEAAFADMDAVLAEDRDKYRNAGGCTALVALFILGKLFVANAGDSRGVLCKRVRRRKLLPVYHRAERNGTGEEEEEEKEGEEKKEEKGEGGEDEYEVVAEPCSFDHTPDTERPRLLTVGKHNPALLGGEYIAMEYAKKPTTKDLGARILYRQGAMKGWTYKTLTATDLKIPLITGVGKRSRLLGTIGVTRGFGDHDLKALGSNLPIKPFLSAHPDVVCFDLAQVRSEPADENSDGEYGILVMATDGLWDVSESQQVANTVFGTLKRFPAERHRYTMVAQELVARSRGRANESGHWRLSDSRAAATVDDISVIVIPVHQYYQEYRAWTQTVAARNRVRSAAAKEVAAVPEAAVARDQPGAPGADLNSESSESEPPEEAQEAENNLNTINVPPAAGKPSAPLGLADALPAK
ncbi:protein phosphatase 1H [Anopheles merus]|uniref:PPM-type phosphatase domain-containing protein n=1 Tax=Anopheles merus TaxID=30066 RepID=A0A182V6P3_ANOME|nr:protein phosphatase 1H [Anopheles merus]XP_041766618.1 protein phosphatase 1H [Anopheles merus]